MSNPNFNPDIGKATQFQEGHESTGGRPKGESITTILRRLADKEITIEEAINGIGTKRKVTNAEAVALRAWEQARKGDANARDYITDRVEGKVADTLIVKRDPVYIIPEDGVPTQPTTEGSISQHED